MLSMRHNHKGQAITELAIFGSLMLLIFGVLLSYLQRQNDQQYVQMEAFRRGLQKACTYVGTADDGAGASVQYTLVEDRRHADLSGSLGKGSPTAVSSSASIYWAIPKSDEDAEADSLIVFRINDDEKARHYREFVPKEHDGVDDKGKKNSEVKWAFRAEDMNVTSASIYEDTIEKKETPSGITNIKSSKLQDTKKVVIPYTIRVEDDDEDDDNDVIVRSDGTFWEGAGYPNGELKQNLYRDSDGQYKYGSQKPDGNTIERTQTWTTAF